MFQWAGNVLVILGFSASLLRNMELLEAFLSLVL